jgi:hypothetical protein
LKKGKGFSDVYQPEWIVAKKYKDVAYDKINETDVKNTLVDNYKVIKSIDLNEDQKQDSYLKTMHIIERYQTLKSYNFKDFSLETTWRNIKLNPQLVDVDTSLKTYLINIVDMYDTFYRWNKLGPYPLYDEVISYFKSGTGIYDQQIQIQQEALDRGEAYNYYTRKRMLDELKYMRDHNN